MLLKFEDFDFSLEGGQIDRVLSFKCLGVILDQKRNGKLYLNCFPSQIKGK